MKEGRGRVYPAYGSMTEELAYLNELRLRVEDLTSDLKEKHLQAEHDGHSIEALVKHMVSAEVSWISHLGRSTTAIIPNSIDMLAKYTQMKLSGYKLDDPIEVKSFTTVGQLIRHVQWHWTYHAGQVGFIRSALHKKYKWTFQ